MNTPEDVTDLREQLNQALARIKELESSSAEISRSSSSINSAVGHLSSDNHIITPSFGEYLSKWKSVTPVAELPTAPIHVNIWSTLATFLGVAFVSIVGQYGFDPHNKLFLMPSLGATAVLIYAAEVSPLAQPYNVIFGHLLSAVVGVIVQIIFQNTTGVNWVKESLAVAIATFVMVTTKSVHPPAGATALYAVSNGQAICQGWFYLVSPVLTSSVLMLLASLVLINIPNQRRFPQYWLVELLHRKTIDEVCDWMNVHRESSGSPSAAESAESVGGDAGSEA